jgi:cell division transport system permease protein
MFFTAITTVAITLFVVGFFLILVYDVQEIITSIKGQVEIAVYLKDNITDDLKVYLEDEITGWNEVSTVEYVSKEEAFERFKEQNEGSDILKEIEGNPLPASFEITLSDPEKVELVALRFVDREGEFIEGVDDVIYGQDYVQKLFAITAIVGTIAFLIIAVLLLATVVLIFNTIRLSIHARRQEVEVMKLVGATNWFVRIPFLIEGLFEGFVGGLISVFLLYFLSEYLLVIGERAVVETMHIRNLAITGADGVILYIYAALVVFGCLLGLISSGFALKRYLKV